MLVAVIFNGIQAHVSFRVLKFIPMEIEIHKGELTWTPKTVIYNGRAYPAPLDLLPMLVQQVVIEELTERKNERNKF